MFVKSTGVPATGATTMATNMKLSQADPDATYTVKGIDTCDPDMNAFLMRLGCYRGEQITLVSKKRDFCIVVIKDGRYCLDAALAQSILV